jgi:hypothetical protein
MIDVRVARREQILHALNDEPILLSEAVNLIDELAELADSILHNPPEIEFGSAEWFAAIDEIPLQERGDENERNR